MPMLTTEAFYQLVPQSSYGLGDFFAYVRNHIRTAVVHHKGCRRAEPRPRPKPAAGAAPCPRSTDREGLASTVDAE